MPPFLGIRIVMEEYSSIAIHNQILKEDIMLSGILRNPVIVRSIQAVMVGVATFYTVKGIEGTTGAIKRSAKKRRARTNAKKLASETTAKRTAKKDTKKKVPAASEAVQAVMSSRPVKDLRLAAREQGVSGYSKMNKRQLAEALVGGAKAAAAEGKIG